MRQIFVLSIIFLLVPLAFFAPFTGLISYVWIAYVRPHEWAYIPNVQISLAVSVATFLGYLVFELTRRAPQLIHNSMLFVLWIQIALATFFAQSPQIAQGKLIEFSKTLLIAVLMTAMVDSEKRVRWLLLGTMVSIGFLAFRSMVGVALTLGQIRVYGPGGAFEDNNDYALLLNVAAPIAFYLARGERDRRIKLICYVISALMMTTVIFTLSRGGYLGLAMVAICLALKSKYKVTGIAVIVLCGLIALALVPSQVVQRVGSISTARETDESAQMRLRTWAICLQIISEHPIFGVGPRNILQIYNRYDESEPVRVAHNSFLQMAVDAGIPALIVFLSLIGLSYFRLRKSRRIFKARAPDSPLIAYSHGMEIALMGYMVSAVFLSRHDLELLYEVMALATSLRLLARDLEREAETRELVERKTYAFEPELVASR